MPSVIQYREIDPIEALVVAKEHADAWKDPYIPSRQYEAFVRKELADFAKGKPVAPFDAFIRCLRQIKLGPTVTLLDVGASGGYYSEVLRIVGFNFLYQGIDFSPAFKELAEKLYPGIGFDVGDARSLPYNDSAFDIVLSGCCMLHILDYEKVISETARVCSRYAIFSKTPVLSGKTKFYEKDAYGVPCLEIHFGEEELLGLFEKHNLSIVHQEDGSKGGDLVHRTYLVRKKSLGERRWETA